MASEPPTYASRGNLQGITDPAILREIRGLWSVIETITGQIGEKKQRFTRFSEVDKVRADLLAKIEAIKIPGFRQDFTGGPGEAVVAAGAPGTTTQLGGGALKGQVFTVSGTFVVPEGVSLVWATMVGGGGSGSCFVSAATGGGGGGASEYMQLWPVPVEPEAAYPVTVGVGGAAVAAGLLVNTAGNFGTGSRFGGFGALGGGGGFITAPSRGIGGGPGAGASTLTAIPGFGIAEASTHFGGSNGGSGGTTVSMHGGNGMGSGGYLLTPGGGATGAAAGGGGGAATIFGLGGAGGGGGVTGFSALSYGAGGGGGGGNAGSTIGSGRGGNGYVFLMWVS